MEAISHNVAIEEARMGNSTDCGFTHHVFGVGWSNGLCRE